jgi:NAD(P)-dependent dehydrogenase (short-subunit alcohol dehydrogenase family)
MSEFDLSGKVVWVTGASRGLGRAIAKSVVAAGATVAATARSRADLEQLAREVGEERLYVYPGAIDDSATVDGIVAQIVSDHGRLDGLVNCAGISPSFTRIENLDDDTWSKVLAVNLNGSFFCSRAAGRAMKADGGGGALVMITSVHASVGFGKIAAYAASKGGVQALTRQMAVEWAGDGIRVNAIAPGYFETDLSTGLLHSHYGEKIRNSTLMGRTGDPRELGPAAVYLLSEASSYVTGATIDVDGGWQAW